LFPSRSPTNALTCVALLCGIGWDCAWARIMRSSVAVPCRAELALDCARGRVRAVVLVRDRDRLMGAGVGAGAWTGGARLGSRARGGPVGTATLLGGGTDATGEGRGACRDANVCARRTCVVACADDDEGSVTERGGDVALCFGRAAAQG
jgi:hypothetical protein